MLSGPIVAMVWEGRDAVKTGRGRLLRFSADCNLLMILTVLLGATNPLQSAPGTIRGDYAIVRSTFTILKRRAHTCCTGCWPERLPWLRQRRDGKKRDRPVVWQR